jgi:hypothetical protein
VWAAWDQALSLAKAFIAARLPIDLRTARSAIISPMCRRRLASIFLCLCLAAPAFAQGADSSSLEIYNGCGMEGDARSPGVQALDRLMNRYTAPQQVDPAITLAAMLAPGRDTGRWKVKQGAEIIGYVSDVKVGGIESTNCHARAAEQRDTHIELVLDPMAGSSTQRVVVEVIPRWPAIMAASARRKR